ncbi:hypothetical protein IMCC3317_40730 [Kordia antarctica]|uniref:Uncharacterized protein n=1 Tax=Kordia antarctica TaxID=1218801 RepID=A0A7L4ZQD0_9FLAO|nr:hypothetical protein [Kordia antarctica]QHI38679.1 hypothetical protein IMCC3317_40730 [Kordia antarctica]
MKKIIYILFFLSLNVHCQEAKKQKILDPVLVEEIHLICERDQLLRGYILTDKEYLLTKEEKKVLWKLQNDIDDYNTRRFIQIVKEHGYVDSSNSNIESFATYAIFMHSSEKYWEEIRLLIDEEKKKGNLDKSSHGIITWHITGRPEPTINYIPNKENDSLNKQ